MSFFTKVKNFFVGVGAKVSAIFIKIFGQDAAQAFAVAALALLKTEVGKIVLDVVALVESASPNLGGAEKRAAALAEILAQFKASGILIGESIINMLIELAVAKMKGNILET